MANRHDVIIWDADVYGTPKSFEEASSMSMLLEDKAESQTNLKIQSFLNKLETIAKSMAETREVFESFQNISKTIDTMAAYVLEMPDEDWEYFLQHVVEIAWQNKLIVFYESLSTVFISPKNILPKSNKKIWNTIVDYNSLNLEPDTLKGFERKLSPIIHVKMIKQGFSIKHKKNHEYIKHTQLGHQVVQFYYESYYSKRSVYFQTFITINAVSDIYKNFNLYSGASDFRFSRNEMIEYEIDFSTKEGLGIFFEEIEKKLFSILACMENNITAVDDLLSQDKYAFFRDYIYNVNKHSGHYAPFLLIAARLANSPRFDELITTFSEPRFGRAIDAIEWLKLVNYLQQEIDPNNFMALYQTLLTQRNAIDTDKAAFLMTMLPPQQEEELALLKTAWHDKSTGLIWQIGCIGEQVCNENPTGVADLLTWQEVLELLKQPKYKHWRLPTKEELQAVEITQNIMYITNHQIASYGLMIDEFTYHWTSNVRSLHDIDYYKKVAPILGDILSRQYANGYNMSCNSDEYKEIMKLFDVKAEEHDVNFSRFCSRKHRITSDMAFLPRALNEKAAVRLVRDTNKVETTMYKTEVKDIPETIQKYLNQVLDEDMAQRGKLDWDAEDTLKFWLIKDDDQLINFLRFGLTSAITKMLDDNEEAWQENNNDSEEDDDDDYNKSIMLREREALAKYPPIYAAVYDIFEFFAAFSFHGSSLIGSWGKDGMKNVIEAFQLLGLEKIAAAYEVSIENIPTYDSDIEDAEFMYDESCQEKIIPAFKTVIDFNITQQHLDVADAVRKNYPLFLV